MNLEEKKILQKIANTVRGLSIDAVEAANSGHPGLPLGCAEIGAFLYAKALIHNPKNPKWINRDRFILSAGHGSAMLYSLLHLSAFEFSLDQLKNFRQIMSPAAGHPEYDHIPGIETTTGPLGQGLANAAGIALGQKMISGQFGLEEEGLLDSTIYVLAGDGCMMEGISAETASFAGHLKLDNLIVIYDSNDICLDGPTSECFTEDTAKRYEAYGWNVQTIDGHNFNEIEQSIEFAKKVNNSPSLIIAKTTIGKGSPNFQGTNEVHGKALGSEEIKLTKEKLGIPLEPLFSISDEVKAYFQKQLAINNHQEAEWLSKFNEWTEKNPDKAKKWQIFSDKKLPHNIGQILSSIEMKPNLSSRKSSQAVLQVLHDQLPFIVGGSADLSGSDCTMMKPDTWIEPGNYAARNIKFGVREFSMGAMCSGLALQGMLWPFCGTFFVFSDYMKNAIRLAALMNIKVIYQFTHDTVWLGEDGPTHQPIEHLASLRSIPNLIVLRPADSLEVKGAWAAILKLKGPAALILSRQNLQDLPQSNFESVTKGAYIIKKETGSVIDYNILASGSEVQLALEVGQELESKGKSVRVVSFPSFELFDAQDKAYQQSVLGNAKKYVSVEAQTSFGWHKYVGRDGITISIDSFGKSAPMKDLKEYFGFTVGKILERILAK